MLRSAPDRRAELQAEVATHFGELFPIFSAALDELDRTRSIQTRREHVECPELRFLLALLLNVPDRERIFELVRDKWNTTNPSEQIRRSLLRLAEQRQLSLRLTPNHEPILELLLDGASDAEVVRRAAPRYGVSEEGGTAQITAFCQCLRADPMVGVLFRPQRTGDEVR